MSRSKRIVLDGEDPDIRAMNYSSLTRGQRPRGRPRITTETAAAPTAVVAADRPFDEHAPMAQYPGAATQDEIDANVDQFVYATTGKSQNDYLREWLPRRKVQLHTLLEMEGPNNPGGVCEICGVAEGDWRCRQCIGGQMVCGACLWKQHRMQPYHRVQRWNGSLFREGGLWEVGVQIYLGHKGHLCPRQQSKAAAEFIKPPAEIHQAIAPDDFVPFVEDPGDPEIPEEDQAGDGDDDDTVFEEVEPPPPDQVKVPTKDNFGNPFISIVDVSGIHYLPVVPCACSNSNDDANLDYLRMGLYPASFQTVKTAFTAHVLKDFRLCNLECKTSAYQYYQKLRRLTSPAFPKSVLNRYRELRRLSRQYRNLKLWMIHGKIYDENGRVDGGGDTGAGSTAADPEVVNDGGSVSLMTPPAGRDTRGTLALFCAACPQPGVNLPDNWKDDPDRNVYTRSLVADGNFKADQLNQKNVDDDVHLTNGEAFMTAPGRYQAHLREADKLAPRYKADPTCHNHHANTDADKGVVGKRVRGVGAHACARHGCFCPSSVVDFTKGEKQMHMDWSLVEAIATTHMDEILRLLHIYDVNCQYAIYLLRRIQDSSLMSIPDILKIVSAIGLFHVHGHKDECLYRYATTYIPGVGIIDGEVLERLWAVLNLMSPSTRGATIAHRTEVLDDHMGDSNWKKIIDTPYSIGKRYVRAFKQEAESKEYFEGMESSTTAALRRKWEAEIAAAEAERDRDAKIMDLMQSKNKKALSRKDIELELGERELIDKSKTGSAAWIADGLQLEEEQLELRTLVRKMGRAPTTAQKLDILKRRRRMRNKIEKYINTASGYLDAGVLHHLNSKDTPIIDTDPETDEWADSDNHTITRADPERQQLPFPSGANVAFLRTLAPDRLARFQGIRNVESEMRAGQANDCIEAIRNDLIQLSWQYKNKVRVNRTQNTKTRAWAGVRTLTSHWRLKRLLYIISRFAMIAAADEPSVNAKYPFLDLHDCVISSVVVSPNKPGQSSDRLNWLWQGVGKLDRDLEKNDYAVEFWRVNWLTARAIHHRWKEEIKLTRKEMEWTIKYYRYQAQEWCRRRDHVPALSEGHIAYAARKVQMWEDLANVGQDHFDSLVYGSRR